jgi:hypothetical protein
MQNFEPSRGVRNNNPGNLEKNGTKWRGLALEQKDSRFYQFVSPEYGIRALARTLITYYDKHGLATVRDIVERWAPPHENDTSAYVKHVARVAGVGSDQPINVRNYLVPLTEAIIIHENGSNPYDMATITRGVSLA